MTAWFRNLSRGQQVAAMVVGAVVAVNLFVAGLQAMVGGGDPGGPVSSSFTTGRNGLEGYADLLRAEGHPVVQLRERVRRADLPAGATVVVADSEGLTRREADAIVAHVRGGGRLVAAGTGTERLLGLVLGHGVVRIDVRSATRIDVWVPTADVGTARVLRGDGGGRWGEVGTMLPLAGADGLPVVAVADVGAGRVVAVADVGPLQNGHLGVADDAALALALAGSGDRPVVFVESAHGFASGGLDAVPSSWKWAAAGAALAMLVGLWSAASRFGPAEPQRRELRPPRRDHVDAVAADLDRVTPFVADAVAPLAAAARADLAAHLGLAADASPGVLFAAAERVGVDASLVELLVTPAPDLDTALAVGAVAAQRRRVALGVADPGTVAASPTDPGASP